ncbi:MAG: archease [Bryobacteraceae bacterium]|jgi:SHS2 domain-containing protein
MEFELLDHPADIGIRAHGASIEELFANCAQALVYIILEPTAIQSAQQVSITVDGGDYESLLVNWLNEVLYYVDGKRIALWTFDISELSDAHIECIAAGEARDAQRHPPKLVVKAVTYHQLKVQRTGNGWIAEVYVDV